MLHSRQSAIGTKEALTWTVRSRHELAQLLRENTELIARIVSAPAAFYTEFKVPKADDELRTIRPPRKTLRSLQRRLLSVLYKRTRVPSYLHGGLPRRSIFTHARGHVGRAMVATLDVRKFFPSTSSAHLVAVLEALGFADGAAQDILALTLLNDELPQGAPTSCLLANLAFSAGDRLFIDLCRRRKLHYTRYVDDIAISGSTMFAELRGPFVEFIERAGYSVADNKIHFNPSSRQQVVTGLRVNAKLRPTAEFISELKHAIRLCLENGARWVADIDGIAVAALQKQLTGRVAHLGNSDPALGKKFRGMLCGVDWSWQKDCVDHG